MWGLEGDSDPLRIKKRAQMKPGSVPLPSVLRHERATVRTSWVHEARGWKFDTLVIGSYNVREPNGLLSTWGWGWGACRVLRRPEPLIGGPARKERHKSGGVSDELSRSEARPGRDVGWPGVLEFVQLPDRVVAEGS